jgi:nitrate/TMAO reductase-like tetraheme cytochrome c subunit
MPPQKKRPSKKKEINPRLKWIAGIFAAVAALGIAAMFVGMQMENRNSFCASCHTQNEENYYQQSLKPNSIDLATFHEQKQTLCIDCHTGSGISGRIGGLMGGTSDLISYYSGHYPQPAEMEEPLGDDNCLKCHAGVFAKQDMNNHFHALLPQWQAIDKKAATCVSCHGGHDKTGDSKIAFLNEKSTVVVCQKCHSTAGAE